MSYPRYKTIYAGDGNNPVDVCYATVDTFIGDIIAYHYTREASEALADKLNVLHTKGWTLQTKDNKTTLQVDASTYEKLVDALCIIHSGYKPEDSLKEQAHRDATTLLNKHAEKIHFENIIKAKEKELEWLKKQKT